MSTPTLADGKYKDTWSLPGSADRNSTPIKDALSPLLQQLSISIKDRKPLILEVASGMGIQISEIAKSNPSIQFQPSDADIYLTSQIDSKVKGVGVENVKKARVLDLLDEENWGELALPTTDANETKLEDDEKEKVESIFDGILCCNLTHICPFEVTKSLFAHLDPRVQYENNGGKTLLNQKVGFIAIYGAFNENGGFTGEGNRKVSFKSQTVRVCLERR